VFLHDERGEITTVLRAALTNSPKLQLPALNNEHNSREQPETNTTAVSMNKALCAALGLPETATEAEVLAAVQALQGKAALNAANPAQAQAVDLAVYAPRSDLCAMEARALAVEKQLAGLNAAALLRDAEATVDGAIRDRKISPAGREECLALCATQEGLEKMKNLFSKSPAIIGAETQVPEGAPPAAGGGAALHDEFRTRMAELDANPVWELLSTVIPSSTASNTYGWLGAFPQMREWVGDRVIKDIAESAYQSFNQKWEATLGVDRTHIEDDSLGQYRVLSRNMADEFDRFMERHLAALITGGFTSLCYDGQPFFNDGHPVYPNTDGTGDAADVSNIIGTGEETGPPWALLSLSGSLKPFIVQQRTQPEFEEITDPKNDRTFMKDQYLYGIRYRGSWGYVLWQQAVGSKAPLTAANYEAARLAMQTFKRDGGDPLGIAPTHLIVSPVNEAAARAILARELINGGESNPNYHTAELVVVRLL
jgi:phage major head subunit gpT-like protein